jgi:MoxR-like ATPase
MQNPSESSANLDHAFDVAARLKRRLESVVRGRETVIDLVLVALLADGHVLLEDFPGSGKTTLARALGESIDPRDVAPGIAAFRRIQFTPDLLPSDITGTSVFDLATNSFSFRPGPLFAHIVLADEINRTSPKVQSAMLEAMGEKQITSDNVSHKLDELFFVIATQNPIDLAGTYPLPSPQLDRFLFKIRMAHVSKAAEMEILAGYPTPSLSRADTLPLVTRAEILEARQTIRNSVALVPAVREGMIDLARALRDDPRVLQGASTRSLVLGMAALQARALLKKRDYVSPEDISVLATPLFEHRLDCRAGIEDVGSVVRDALGPLMDRLARVSTKG